MFACVTSLAASLLYLAPVLLMVGFVVFAKLRGGGAETDAEPAPAFEFERREGAGLEPLA